ncbi:ABC transporter permease [Agaribacterium haliotis]|uniref:ABC transporter permease n=1 Tax=Agaribacterium haliotis TaxID=2013869 RepID=UPI000BB53AB9|nr:ABC transporter permease [Agaribacterium haliotis]
MSRALVNAGWLDQTNKSRVWRERLAHLVRVYTLETKYEWLKTLRNPAFSLPVVLFPLMFYLFFAVVLNADNVEAATYLLCTYASFGVMGPALFSFGAGLAVERSKGWLQLKSISPMPASAQILSRTLVSMLFSLIIVLLMMLVAQLFAGVTLAFGQLLSLVITLVLASLPFCLMGLALGLLLKAESAAAIINAIYLPMSFLSGLWLPIAMLPEFLQGFAYFLPSYHLSQLALIHIGQSQGGSVLAHVAMLGVFSLLFLVFVVMAYARQRRL